MRPDSLPRLWRHIHLLLTYFSLMEKVAQLDLRQRIQLACQFFQWTQKNQIKSKKEFI